MLHQLPMKYELSGLSPTANTGLSCDEHRQLRSLDQACIVGSAMRAFMVHEMEVSIASLPTVIAEHCLQISNYHQPFQASRVTNTSQTLIASVRPKPCVRRRYTNAAPSFVVPSIKQHGTGFCTQNIAEVWQFWLTYLTDTEKCLCQRKPMAILLKVWRYLLMIM